MQESTGNTPVSQDQSEGLNMTVNSTLPRATEGELDEADKIIDALNKKHGDVFDK